MKLTMPRTNTTKASSLVLHTVRFYLITRLLISLKASLDLMHCVLQNLLPQIHALWGGTKQSEAEAAAKEDREFKARLRQLNIEIDEQPLQEQSPPPCVLPPKEWFVIAKYMFESASTIAQLLGKAPRAIDTRHKSFKAMEWCVMDPRYSTTWVLNSNLQNFILLRYIFAHKVGEDYYSWAQRS
jgi:hypothetical protein